MHCHLQLKNPTMLNEWLNLACDVKRCYQFEDRESTVLIPQPQLGKRKSVLFHVGSDLEEPESPALMKADAKSQQNDLDKIRRQLAEIQEQLQKISLQVESWVEESPRKEMTQLGQLNMCYCCGKDGHWSTDCPANPYQGRGGVHCHHDGLNVRCP